MPRSEQLAEFRRHAEWALVAATAQELGFFASLAADSSTPAALAARLGLSVRGTEILLGALEELSLVRRGGEGEGKRYRLTEAGRAAFVDQDSPNYQGGAVRVWHQNIRRLAEDLGRAVREGGPPASTSSPGTGDASDPEALARFMAAMDNKPPAQVEAVVEGCLARAPQAREMLDLGGGPGTFARAFASRGVRATVFDRAEVIAHVAEQYGLRENPRIRLQSGDFLIEPPEGKFDLVLLANITHIYDPPANARLLRSLVPHLRPGGVLAILDFMRSLSEFAPLFAITMLLNTEQGNTYSREDYLRWLEEAGLQEVRFSNVDADRALVTAVRGGG